MTRETYLVTGALGCIGSWVLKQLVAEGARVVAGDLGSDPVRPRLIMSENDLAKIDWQVLDITDLDAVKTLVAGQGITKIIHLAGLQIPFCRANPPLGAAVNVTGTINIFEAACASGVKGLAYASSLAALGPASDYDTWPLPDSAVPQPRTLYGSYKVANEQAARVYAADWQVGSVGLRPAVVYGVGRDQGLTADFAKATLAASAGLPFHIRTDGLSAMHHARDVAEMFIRAAKAEVTDARVCNVRNDVITTADFIARLTGVLPDAEITFEKGAELPFPADLSDAELRRLLGRVPHTPMDEAIAADVAMFRDLAARDAIDMTQLER